MKFKRKISLVAAAILTLPLILSGCSGVSLVKQGEDDAVSACQEILKLQTGGDDLSVDDGMTALFTAEAYAQSAADQNDDYVELSDAISGLADSLMYGSEAMAGTAWASVANFCNNM